MYIHLSHTWQPPTIYAQKAHMATTLLKNSLDLDFPFESIHELLLCDSLEDRLLTLGSCVHVCFLKILEQKSFLEKENLQDHSPR